jgi:hypothetical protein
LILFIEVIEGYRSLQKLILPTKMHHCTNQDNTKDMEFIIGITYERLPLWDSKILCIAIKTSISTGIGTDIKKKKKKKKKTDRWSHESRQLLFYMTFIIPDMFTLEKMLHELFFICSVFFSFF